MNWGLGKYLKKVNNLKVLIFSNIFDNSFPLCSLWQ